MAKTKTNKWTGRPAEFDAWQDDVVIEYNAGVIRANLKHAYMTKYFNLFLTLFKVKEGMDHNQENYIKIRLWEDGTFATFNEKISGESVFVPYCPLKWNIYNYPEEETLVNLKGVPFIPTTVQVVGKDVVNCYIQNNRRGVREVVEGYINRIVDIEMVISQNLQLHKMPFVFTCSPEDLKKVKNLVAKIIRGDAAVVTELEATEAAKILNTGAPYLIDKLNAYKNTLENELLSYLGIDNTGNSAKATTETLDEVNANNVLINLGRKQFEENLEKFSKEVKEVLGKTITFEFNAEEAEETYESRNRSDAYNGKENTKGEGGEEDD